MAHPLVERAARRLARLLQAAGRSVEQPAVVQAAQAAVLQPPVAQVGAAVGAVQPQQARLALLVAEQHQVFAQQPHRQRRAARR